MCKNIHHIELKLYKKVVVIGVGNKFRRDDGVGIFIAEQIREVEKISMVVSTERLEDYVDIVIRERPSLILVFDCMNFCSNPGAIGCFRLREIKLKKTLSSHTLPLLPLLRYIKSEIGKCDVVVVGIQPADLSYGMGLSKEVMASAYRIVRNLYDGVVRCLEGGST